MNIGTVKVALELLPAPEPDEVVATLFEEAEIGAVIENIFVVGARCTEPKAIVEVVVDVRAGEVHHLIVMTSLECKIARVDA